jgi:hypothetical protein
MRLCPLILLLLCIQLFLLDARRERERERGREIYIEQKERARLEMTPESHTQRSHLQSLGVFVELVGFSLKGRLIGFGCAERDCNCCSSPEMDDLNRSASSD